MDSNLATIGINYLNGNTRKLTNHFISFKLVFGY